MINTEGFKFGVMLGWMEVLGVTLCSGIERSSIPLLGNGEGRRPRSAPLIAYPPLTVCLLMSSSLASWSLNYINFPTKVVFRSCKLLPTMILAVLMGNAKRFTIVEVGSAIAVCTGLITFASGDWILSNPKFHPFGLTLVTMSVFADAILPNAQEKLFRTYDASKSESNKSFFPPFLPDFGNLTMKQDVLLSEDTADTHIRYTFLTYMLAYILMSHIAVSAHTAVVKKFGGVAAVFIGTARKGMTLVLSFALFPKESNWRYAVGAMLVLGGLTVASLEKQRNKQRNKNPGAEEDSTNSHAEKCFVPSLPYNSNEQLYNEAMEQGQSQDETEYKPLLNGKINSCNGPERRR
eukprot:scaffold78688_cov59-Cyclotella_meneghiniana.AAC.3